MTEAQLRLGALLSVVLAGMAALVYFWTPSEEEKDPDATAAVWEVKADDVTKVEVDRPDSKLVVEKDGDAWKVDEPYQYGADSWKTRDLVDALAGVQKGVPIPDADPAKFGLGDPPAAKVTLTMADGSTKTLEVGQKAPVGFRSYVKGADGAVVAVSGDLADKVSEPAEDFRDKRVMHFEVANVGHVVLQEPEGTLDVTRDDQDRFWLKGYTRASEDKVEDLLLGLLDLRFDKFLDQATVGTIAQPRYVVTVDTRDGESEKLLVGDETSEGTVVQVEGGPSSDGRAPQAVLSGVVQADSLKLLGQGPTDIGDKQAFPVDPIKLTGVDVDLGGVQWSITKDGDVWKRDGKDEPKGEDAVAVVQHAQITYQKDPVPDITAPFGKVTLHDGDRAEVVDVGQLEANGRVAKDEAGGAPYFVSEQQISAIKDFWSTAATPQN